MSEISVTVPWDEPRQAVDVSIAMVQLGAVDVRIERQPLGDTSFQWRVSGQQPEAEVKAAASRERLGLGMPKKEKP